MEVRKEAAWCGRFFDLVINALFTFALPLGLDFPPFFFSCNFLGSRDFRSLAFRAAQEVQYIQNYDYFVQFSLYIA